VSLFRLVSCLFSTIFLLYFQQPLSAQSASPQNPLIDEGGLRCNLAACIAEEHFHSATKSTPENPSTHLDLGLAPLREIRLIDTIEATDNGDSTRFIVPAFDRLDKK
jgi:hypothetical protein